MFLFGLENPLIFVVWIVAILISLSAHEFSHAFLGNVLGDKTAEREGRLTLNPLAHIDWLGLFSLVFIGFGWGKPVPFNPTNLKNPRWDAVKIAIAGPVSNLIMAILSGAVLRLVLLNPAVAANNLLIVFLVLMVVINLVLMFFNLIPIHPLDGSKLLIAILDKPKYYNFVRWMLKNGSNILLVMIIIDIMTPLNIFGFFLEGPVFTGCNMVIGDSCITLLSSIF